MLEWYEERNKKGNWKDFRKFVENIEKLCCKKTGFKLVFRSKPWDTTGDLIKNGTYYTHANFSGKNAEEFIACVRSVAKSEGVNVLVNQRKRGPEEFVSVYYPLEEKAEEILRRGILARGIDEAEEFLKEQRIL